MYKVTCGQSQRGLGPRVSSGVGGAGGSNEAKMETTVLAQRFKKRKKNI